MTLAICRNSMKIKFCFRAVSPKHNNQSSSIVEVMVFQGKRLCVFRLNNRNRKCELKMGTGNGNRKWELKMGTKNGNRKWKPKMGIENQNRKWEPKIGTENRNRKSTTLLLRITSNNIWACLFCEKDRQNGSTSLYPT